MLVHLTSYDGKVFLVEARIARMSQTVGRLMEAFNMDEEEDDQTFVKTPIPLSNVSSVVLEKVLEWCTNHQSDESQEDKEG
ncbi:hypothetical protein PENTCL1PPCAC_2949, partial [Pristionchus entomophagus]